MKKKSIIISLALLFSAVSQKSVAQEVQLDQGNFTAEPVDEKPVKKPSKAGVPKISSLKNKRVTSTSRAIDQKVDLDTLSYQLDDNPADYAELRDILQEAKGIVKRIKNAELTNSLTPELLEEACAELDRSLSKCASCSNKSSKVCFCLIQKLRRELAECCGTINEKLDRIEAQLKKLDTILVKLDTIIEELKKILIELAKHCECIVIDSVPVVLDVPGNYCLKKDLFYPGNEAAIFIEADNVCIDLCCKTLSTNPNAMAIFAENRKHLEVRNGSIKSSAPGVAVVNVLIRLLNTERVIVDNVGFTDGWRSIFAGTAFGEKGVIDLQVLNCEFNTRSSGTPTAIRVQQSNGVVIDNCIFSEIGVFGENSGFTIIGIVDVHNVLINNCQFLNPEAYAIPITMQEGWSNIEINNCTAKNGFHFAQFIGRFSVAGTSGKSAIVRNCVCTIGSAVGGFDFINFSEADGLLVENCVFGFDFSTPPFFSPGNGISCGSTSAMGRPAKNVIIRNSTLSHPNATPGYDNIALRLGDGALIENCILNSNPAGVPDGALAANIHIGSSNSTYNNVRVVNTIVHNNAQFGILVEGDGENPSKNIVIESCSVDGAVDAGIRLNDTWSSVVKGTHVKNTAGGTGHGIVLGANSSFNALIENTSAQNTGTGILIEDTALNNLVKGNDSFNNDTNGIEDENGPSTNQIYFNTACNNGGINCVGILPALVGAPGSSPVTLGQNICCVQ